MFNFNRVKKFSLFNIKKYDSFIKICLLYYKWKAKKSRSSSPRRRWCRDRWWRQRRSWYWFQFWRWRGLSIKNLYIVFPLKTYIKKNEYLLLVLIFIIIMLSNITYFKTSSFIKIILTWALNYELQVFFFVKL